MLKKVLSFCLSVILLLSCTLGGYAQEVIPTSAYTLSENLVANNHHRQISQYIANLENTGSTTRGGDDSYYLPVHVDTGYATVDGIPDGQPAGGTRFTSGGSFYWNPSGGTKTTASVGVSFGGVISVSISFGSVTATNIGYALDVPDTTNYYKLYVKKVLQVKKYIIYEYDSVTDEQIGVYGTTYSYSDYNYTLYAVKVV